MHTPVIVACDLAGVSFSACEATLVSSAAAGGHMTGLRPRVPSHSLTLSLAVRAEPCQNLICSKSVCHGTPRSASNFLQTCGAPCSEVSSTRGAKLGQRGTTWIYPGRGRCGPGPLRGKIAKTAHDDLITGLRRQMALMNACRLFWWFFGPFSRILIFLGCYGAVA